MLLSIDGFYINTVSPGQLFGVSATYPTDGTLLPPGRSAYASIALSFYDTEFASRDNSDPSVAVAAVIDSWTVYNPDGTQSDPIKGREFTQNTAVIDNCATINFSLYATRAWAMAQVTVFVFG